MVMMTMVEFFYDWCVTPAFSPADMHDASFLCHFKSRYPLVVCSPERPWASRL